jgi:uncharacterized membrane protein SpoIIM required for sporulation
MIIDLAHFIDRERKYWDEMEALLKYIEEEPLATLSLEKVERLHYLYERTSADLARVNTFASEPETRRYLEILVARAYGEIHEVRGKPHRFDPLGWFFKTFPRTFRKHIAAFWLSLAITLLGCALGAGAIALDPDSRYVLLPFEHSEMTPQERVKEEENATKDRLAGHKASFSAFLQTHNIQVSLQAFAYGATWGIGTILVIFENGLMLGAICVDYIRAHETAFLVGWLLPHGSFEIPAILVAGQAGFILAGAIIGWRKPFSLRERLRLVSNDLVTLVFGLSLMLLWAGFVESFLSQYHEPVLPYSMKIAFGCVELVLLISFFAFSGRSDDRRQEGGVTRE